MRVLIADDHALFRDGLRSLLEARGIEVVDEAENGLQAVELAKRHQPDVVLMDLTMPNMDGVSATRHITADDDLETNVVVLTASDADDDLFEAIRSGANGYLLKDLEPNEFFELLEGSVRGEPALTPRLARKLLDAFSQSPGEAPPDPEPPAPPIEGLTDREQEVLELMVGGVTSNKKLAEALVISENTVKFHLRNILSKLHLKNRAQVVSYAIRNRMVEVPPRPTNRGS